ncbi:polar amino acid transport system substrate-binding protein [Roseibium hamelinense]|uniref:Polar amino acid transport system substrate-binding protein n=1 Tax=Roseibium hamelinense TaxID=150831 RepID=A0A562TJH2_9HYPH|nr:transporter substrate-binding domain-containing protein [Roseibium hamelinense]MTI45623.1 transporter substrate-binding domain-containing protein [Roseibium hamelinense]TWI93196.1 polar amino acid transport system substrate-binding protein [Roseibium hamelinense]
MSALRAITAIAAVTFATSVFAADIKLTTEDYPPYNFKEGDKIVGLGADQAFEIMKRAGITYDVEMAQWSRALGLAENEAGYCVFTTAHTEERDAKFLWVEPLNKATTLLIKKAGSDVNPTNLEEAKAFTVGTQTDDYTESILKNEGFPKIDPAKNMETSVKKLVAGRTDLIAVSEAYFNGLVRDGVEVEKSIVLAESLDGIACNPGTDKALVDKMQAALDSMIADGTQAKILAKYE